MRSHLLGLAVPITRLLAFCWPSVFCCHGQSKPGLDQELLLALNGLLDAISQIHMILQIGAELQVIYSRWMRVVKHGSGRLMSWHGCEASAEDKPVLAGVMLCTYEQGSHCS